MAIGYNINRKIRRDKFKIKRKGRAYLLLKDGVIAVNGDFSDIVFPGCVFNYEGLVCASY